MKITIRDDKCKEEPEATMELFLRQTGNLVHIAGVAGHKNFEWKIATITEEGIRLVGGIHKDTGWPLDFESKENKCGKLKQGDRA